MVSSKHIRAKQNTKSPRYVSNTLGVLKVYLRDFDFPVTIPLKTILYIQADENDRSSEDCDLKFILFNFDL